MTAARNPIPHDSTIIAAFWWPDSRADVACKLKTNAAHVRRVWLKAKASGALPVIKRPKGGFDLRGDAMDLARRLFPHTAFIVPIKTEKRSPV